MYPKKGRHARPSWHTRGFLEVVPGEITSTISGSEIVNIPSIDESTLRTVCDTLQDRAVVSFVVDTVKAGYQECFREHQENATSIASKAFAALEYSQGHGIDPRALLAATSDLLRNVFRTHDKLFWFHLGYQRYKTIDKPEMDLAQLKPLIPGNRILDYGCGSGYLAARLDKAGYSVITTDVLDYRYHEASHLPFKAIVCLRYLLSG